MSSVVIDAGVGHLPWADDLPEVRDVHQWDEGAIRAAEAWLKDDLFAEHYRGVTMTQLREKVAEWHASGQDPRCQVFQNGSERDRLAVVVVVLHDWHQRGKLSTNGTNGMSLPPGAGC